MAVWRYLRKRTRPAGLAVNALSTAEFSRQPFGEIDLTECLNAIGDAAERVNRGDSGDAEGVLSAQAVTLNAMCAAFAHRFSINTGHSFEAMERYMRLALKAQSQCRTTLETLAAIKNPPVVFARQANIANGPQQVNNQPAGPRAGNLETTPNEVLAAHVERVDLGAAKAAGAGDQALAAVAVINRSENA